MAATMTESSYGTDPFSSPVYGGGGEGGEGGGPARREGRRSAPEGSEGSKSPGKTRKSRKGGSLFKWGSQDDGVTKSEKSLRGKRSNSSSTEVLDDQNDTAANSETHTDTAYKTSPITEAKSSSSDMKKVQRLNRELSKQNSQLLKSVDALKKERESLLTEKQKLKSDNKLLEKGLKKSSPSKKGLKHTSKANSFEASEDMETLAERIEKLEAQLAAKDAEIATLQKKLEVQSDLLRADTLEKKKRLVDADVHELEDTNNNEKNKKNRETISDSHSALSRLLEEQDVSSRMRKENSELRFRISSMEDELEQLKVLLEQQRAQQVEQSPKSSKRSTFFKRGKKNTSSLSSRSLEDTQKAFRDQASRRSKSPDIHTTSDSALHHYASHGKTDEKGAIPSPKSSPRFSPHHHRSGSALADVQTLQTCLKLAFEEKHSLNELNKRLEDELKETKSRIEKLQQNSPRVRKTNQEVEILKQTLKVALTEKAELSEEVVLLRKEVEDSKAMQETMASELADTMVKQDFKIERLEKEKKKLTQEISELKLTAKSIASAADSNKATTAQNAKTALSKAAAVKLTTVESVKPKSESKPVVAQSSSNSKYTPSVSDVSKTKQTDSSQSSHIKAKPSMAAASPSAVVIQSREPSLPSSPPNAISPVRSSEGVPPASIRSGSRTRERLYTAPSIGSAMTSRDTTPLSPSKDNARSSSMESDAKPHTSTEKTILPSSSSFQAQKSAITEKSKSTPEFKTESSTTTHPHKLFKRQQSRTKVSAACALFEEKIEEHTSPKKSARKVSWTIGGSEQTTSSGCEPVDSAVKTHSKSSSFDSAKIMSTTSPSLTTGKPQYISRKTEPFLRTEFTSDKNTAKSSITSPVSKEPATSSKVSSITVKSNASPQGSPVLNKRKDIKEISVQSPGKQSRDSLKHATFSPTSPNKPFTMSSSSPQSSSFSSQMPGKEVRMRSNTTTSTRPSSFIAGGSEQIPETHAPVTKSFTIGRFASIPSSQGLSSSYPFSSVQQQQQQQTKPVVQMQSKSVTSPTSPTLPQVPSTVRTEKVVIRQIARKHSVPTPSTSNNIGRVSPLKEIPERINAPPSSSSFQGGKTSQSTNVDTTTYKPNTSVPLRTNRRPRSERPATMFAGSGTDRLASLVVQLQEQDRQKRIMMNGSSRSTQRPSSMVFQSSTSNNEPVSAKNLAWGGGQRRSKKSMLLKWCQYVTTEYQNVMISNFGASFSDGMAFCAILHHFIPDKIPFYTLQAQNRAKNFKIAFEAAESEGIPSLLDIEDMVALPIPDWMSVMTYVSFIYNKFGQPTSS